MAENQLNSKIKEKIKSDIDFEKLENKDWIPIYLNKKYLSGDNEKYMKMYNKLSKWYDFWEKWIGFFIYGNSIAKVRTNLMEHLEWKNGASVLYISIVTGKYLKFIKI